MQLLDKAMTPAELYATIHGGTTPREIDRAIDTLVEAGVICRDGGSLSASTAVSHLDGLRLICV